MTKACSRRSTLSSPSSLGGDECASSYPQRAPLRPANGSPNRPLRTWLTRSDHGCQRLYLDEVSAIEGGMTPSAVLHAMPSEINYSYRRKEFNGILPLNWKDISRVCGIPNKDTNNSDAAATLAHRTLGDCTSPYNTFSQEGHSPVLDVTFLVENFGYEEPGNPSLMGGFGVVRRGILKDGNKIAVKTLKPRRRLNTGGANVRQSKRLTNEVNIWQKLKHRNILPFLGVVTSASDDISTSMVSPWVQNGNCADYCRRNKNTPRLPILKGVIDGIAYLHSQSIVHGDIKGTNVLIGDGGTPLLCDFGLAKVCEPDKNTRTVSTSLRDAGTVRYMSIELLMSESPGVDITKASDMWAFGMFCVEILSGNVPYSHLKNDGQVIVSVYRGETPSKPRSAECTSIIWALLRRCWDPEPSRRVVAEEISRELDESI